jgi:hypothetical protein
MRWIKKEFDEDGNPEWVVYIDEAGEGREDDWVHYDTFEGREEAIEACASTLLGKTYDPNDKT